MGHACSAAGWKPSGPSEIRESPRSSGSRAARLADSTPGTPRTPARSRCQNVSSAAREYWCRRTSSDVSTTRSGSNPRSMRLARSEEHTSELQSLRHLVCRLLLEKKKGDDGPEPGEGDAEVRNPVLMGHQPHSEPPNPQPPVNEQFIVDHYHHLLFFFNDTPTTDIYTLSLHDALPICRVSLFLSMALCLLLRLFVFRLLRLKRFSTLTLKVLCIIPISLALLFRMATCRRVKFL